MAALRRRALLSSHPRELVLERRKSPVERASDSAREQRRVDETGEPATGLVLDKEPVDESVAVSVEVALELCVGLAGLRAGVRHEASRLERGDHHGEFTLAAEE